MGIVAQEMVSQWRGGGRGPRGRGSRPPSAPPPPGSVLHRGGWILAREGPALRLLRVSALALRSWSCSGAGQCVEELAPGDPGAFLPACIYVRM